MNKPATKLFSLQLTEDDNRRLKAIADRKGVTMSGAVRMWIRKDRKNLEAT